MLHVCFHCQGNIDAIRRCLWVLEEFPVDEFLVLPGHHLYKMDYQKLIEAHRNRKADITIMASSAIRDQDPGLGLLKVNTENQVIDFRMKSDREPASSISVSCFQQLHLHKTWFCFFRCSFEKLLSKFQAEALRRSRNSTYENISSMGIYLINREVMARLVNEHFPEANDFANELIPGAISTGMKVRFSWLCQNFPLYSHPN